MPACLVHANQPGIMQARFTYSIPTGWDDFGEKLSFAAARGLGLELAMFASGPAVHDPSLRKRMERELAAAFNGFPFPLSYHAAFIDLAVHSDDPAVAALSRARLRRDAASATRLGCRSLVAHTGFNPLVPVNDYRRQFLWRHAAFWPALAGEFPGLTFCLENLWEPELDLFQELLEATDHPRVKCCLDVAHANVHGIHAPETWVQRLAPVLGHMHWNDNLGDRDSHLALGVGDMNWRTILRATRALRQPLSVVLELRSLAAICQSLRHLEGLESGLSGLAAASGGNTPLNAYETPHTRAAA